MLHDERCAVDAMRFLNQFQVGSGDYTEEREELFQNDTVKSIVAVIKAQRS
jgi:predicted sugar kinase